MPKVTRTERGWPGHYCCAYDCVFRRNTLLECNDSRIVISTVGNHLNKKENRIMEIGYERYYETMVFIAKFENGYWDASIHNGEISFNSNWSIDKPCMDNEANEMHELVIKEFTKRLKNGEKFIYVEKEKDDDA